jgi:hypothetical protein
MVRGGEEVRQKVFLTFKIIDRESSVSGSDRFFPTTKNGPYVFPSSY